MTKNELMRRQHLQNTLTGLGFTVSEAESLRRISNTLRRWFELECGNAFGSIERGEDGKPVFRNVRGLSWAVADRETGARRRLDKIIAERNKRLSESESNTSIFSYVQTDPRGAALYILRSSDVIDGMSPAQFYSRGICIF